MGQGVRWPTGAEGGGGGPGDHSHTDPQPAGAGDRPHVVRGQPHLGVHAGWQSLQLWKQRLQPAWALQIIEALW